MLSTLTVSSTSSPFPLHLLQLLLPLGCYRLSRPPPRPASVGSFLRSPIAAESNQTRSYHNTTFTIPNVIDRGLPLPYALGLMGKKCVDKQLTQSRHFIEHYRGPPWGTNVLESCSTLPRFHWLPPHGGWQPSKSQETACLGVRGVTGCSDTPEYHGRYATAGSNRLSSSKRTYALIRSYEPYSSSGAIGHEHHGTLTVMCLWVCPGNCRRTTAGGNFSSLRLCKSRSRFLRSTCAKSSAFFRINL